MYLDFDDSQNNLMWALGKTGRTSFFWTIAPPGTKFQHSGDNYEFDIYHLSIFKWNSYLLWSSLDIELDDVFAAFLKYPHARKDYNGEYQGEDFSSLYYTNTLPLGNHVIALCQAAGLLEQLRSRHFCLKENVVRRTLSETAAQIRKLLLEYLDRVKVPREEIETHPRRLAKKMQDNAAWDKYMDRRIFRDAGLLAKNTPDQHGLRLNRVWSQIGDSENGLEILLKRLDDYLVSIRKEDGERERLKNTFADLYAKLTGEPKTK